jgi:hypothetical protein
MWTIKQLLRSYKNLSTYFNPLQVLGRGGKLPSDHSQTSIFCITFEPVEINWCALVTFPENVCSTRCKKLLFIFYAIFTIWRLEMVLSDAKSVQIWLCRKTALIAEVFQDIFEISKLNCSTVMCPYCEGDIWKCRCPNFKYGRLKPEV